MSHAGGTTNLYVKVYSATGTGSGLVAMLYAMYDAYGIKTTEEVENNNWKSILFLCFPIESTSNQRIRPIYAVWLEHIIEKMV